MRLAALALLLAAAPDRLEFTSAPQQVTAGSCSAPLVVELRDDGGTPVIVAADTPVMLSGAPAFYDSTGCPGQPVTQVQILTGRSIAAFWVRATEAGTFPVAAASAGVTSATQDARVLPDVPAALGFTTGPFTIDAGQCSPGVTFQVQDRYGNSSPPASLTQVTATTGGSDAEVFSDPRCSIPMDMVGIAAPGDGFTWYFRDMVGESFTLALGAPGLTGASQVETVREDRATVALELAGDAGFAGSEQSVHAVVTNTGNGLFTGMRLRLEAQGMAMTAEGPYPLPTMASGVSVPLEQVGIITVTAGMDVFVRGRVEDPEGNPISSEVTARRTVAPAVVDLGPGCGGCSAGGAELTAVAASLVFLARRRRDLARAALQPIGSSNLESSRRRA
ncbi:MAG TPA: hypothetical protein VND93_12555 [Myxococcales bacterium]|nr:hypothetical protein [Myxococcales bacterium]